MSGGIFGCRDWVGDSGNKVREASEAAKHPTRHRMVTVPSPKSSIRSKMSAARGVCWVPRSLVVFVRHESASARFHYGLSELSSIE